jgi:hypothetical protein
MNMKENFKYNPDENRYDYYRISHCSRDLYLRKGRCADKLSFLKDISRALETCERRYRVWDAFVWKPFEARLQKSAELNGGKLIMHTKPTHNYNGDQDMWWEYEYSYHENFKSWGYNQRWIKEPDEKLNLKLGNTLYELSTKSQRVFGNKRYWLEHFLKQELERYVYSMYDYSWLMEYYHLEKEKLIKIILADNEYWYKIVMNKHGVPCWQNFIWRSGETEVVQL